MITTIRRRNPGRTGGGGKFYAAITPGQSGYITFDELKQFVKAGDVVFDRMDQEEADKVLISLIYHTETNYNPHLNLNRDLKGDTKLLTRIIRNGGAVNYINKLEMIEGIK